MFYVLVEVEVDNREVELYNALLEQSVLGDVSSEVASGILDVARDYDIPCQTVGTKGYLLSAKQGEKAVADLGNK